jgi:lycopene cyclase domain-containing protein
MTPETYLGFHLLFVLPPLVLVSVFAYVRPAAMWGRVPFFGLGVILVLAVAYTTPWDNLLISYGVWRYGDGVTAGTIFAAPLGEYLFFVFQPALVALWLYNLDIPTDGSLRLSIRSRLVGLAAGLAVSALGIGLLVAGPSTLYLGSILAWAGPILAIQWSFGWPHLIRARRTVAIAIGVPTVYLCAIDWYAITNGLWTVSTAYSTGITLLGLPIEEAVFFLMTNVFIVQGLVLYLWLLDQWPTVAPAIRPLFPPRVASLFSIREPTAGAEADLDDQGDDCNKTTS